MWQGLAPAFAYPPISDTPASPDHNRNRDAQKAQSGGLDPALAWLGDESDIARSHPKAVLSFAASLP